MKWKNLIITIAIRMLLLPSEEPAAKCLGLSERTGQWQGSSTAGKTCPAIRIRAQGATDQGEW
jgi:hypothetical protein